jgi:hypothetical protein
MHRSAEYGEELKMAAKNLRQCKRCGLPRLRKKELVAFLDAVRRNDHEAQQRAIELAAAQVAGFCGSKCRSSSKR